MNEELKKTTREELEKLPKETQMAIGSLDWVKIVEDIGKKYLLSENEINNLQIETLLILTGLTDPDFFATYIENNVITTKKESEKIAGEITEKIFTPINDAFLKNVKSSDKVKAADPAQNLNFILSGGDYSAFVEPSGEETNATPPNLPLSGEVNATLPLTRGNTRGLSESTTSPHPDQYREPVPEQETGATSSFGVGAGEVNYPPRPSATLEEGNTIPQKPRRITDIKSKFTK